MTAIKINMNLLREENIKMSLCVEKAGKIIDDIATMRRKIPINIRQEQNIEFRINEIVNKMSSIENRLKEIRKFVDESADVYSNLETHLNGEIEKKLRQWSYVKI